MENEQVAETVEEQVVEEVVVEPEVMPVASHVAYKHKVQERLSAAELKAANLEGQLTALTAQHVQPAAKSPLDTEIERQAADGIEEDDMSLSPKVLRQERAYQANLAQEATNVEAQKNLGAIQTASVNAARLVHDDYDAVVNEGQNLMTNGEYLDVTEAGKGFGKLAYDTAKAAIARSKPAPKAEAAPKQEPSESETEAKAAEKAKEVPSREEALEDAKKEIKSENPAIDAKMRL